MYPDSVSRVHFLFVLIYGKSGFLCNSGKLSLVPYTKDFGRITHF